MIANRETASIDTAPRVYSYLRYSSRGQDDNDSIQRQTAATKAFAERKGLVLDDSLRMPDKHISAFRGRHRKQGVLANFLHDVEAGRVPEGSYLVFEAVDRLTREGVRSTLENIIYKLWDHNIILQTLSPETSYEAGCEDDVKFLVLWTFINEAHKSSELKSIRLYSARNAARKAAREDGKLVTARIPSWLDPVWEITGANDKRLTGFRVKAGAAEVVEKIFQWKLQGLHIPTIVNKLNRDKSVWKPPIGKGQETGGWRDSYVRRILTAPSVTGVYQPYTKVWKTVDGEQLATRKPAGEAIPNYFPRIIGDGVYYAVQDQLAQNNRRTGGPVAKAFNLFRGIVKCGYCGGPLHYIDNTHNNYLLCDNGRRGVKCRAVGIPYPEVETTILQNCRGLKPQAVLPDQNEQNALCESLRKRIAGNTAKQADLAKRIENLVDQIESTSSPTIRQTYEQRIVEREQETQAVAAQIEEDRRDLQHAEHDLRGFRQWQTDLTALQKALAKHGDAELRLRLAAHLRQLIDRIEIFPYGFAAQYRGQGAAEDKAATKALRNRKHRDTLTPEERAESRKPRHRNCFETIADTITEIPDPGFGRWLVAQRMSKRGRFIRVFFVSGQWCDLVPMGSIATGRRLTIGEDGDQQWEQVQPPLDTLYAEYEQQSKRKHVACV